MDEDLQQILEAKERSKEKGLLIGEENASEDCIGSIKKYMKQKWYSEILYKLKGGYKFKQVFIWL